MCVGGGSCGGAPLHLHLQRCPVDAHYRFSAPPQMPPPPTHTHSTWPTTTCLILSLSTARPRVSSLLPCPLLTPPPPRRTCAQISTLPAHARGGWSAGAAARLPLDLGATGHALSPRKIIKKQSRADLPSEHYLEWMRMGTHIITPNKKMNSGPLQRYQARSAGEGSVRTSLFFWGGGRVPSPQSPDPVH